LGLNQIIRDQRLYYGLCILFFQTVDTTDPTSNETFILEVHLFVKAHIIDEDGGDFIEGKH